MSPDEARELTRQVAEALGWTEIHTAALSFCPETYNRWTGHPPDPDAKYEPLVGSYSGMAHISPDMRPSPMVLGLIIPDYATSWDAIPEMLGYFRRYEYDCDICCNLEEGYVSLWLSDYSFNRFVITEVAGDVPEAIARGVVALKARLDEEKKA